MINLQFYLEGLIMKHGILMTLLLATMSFQVMADIKRPTCEEEPTRRDCIKVEDPDAVPPRHTVKQNPNNKKPVQLPAKPRPKSAR
jgi:hypothetical protein